MSKPDKYGEIYRLCPEAFRKEVDGMAGYADPEWIRYAFGVLVNRYVEKNPDDKVSVKIYSLLTERSEQEIRAQFIKDGFGKGE